MLDFIPIALPPNLDPDVPEHCLRETRKFLALDTLIRSIDILDLRLHRGPWTLLTAGLWRLPGTQRA